MEIFTFLFTDIEGSTALLGRVGQGVYAQVLADHHSIIRSGLASHDGREIDTQGDAFFAVFASPAACVAAAVQIQRALAAHAWPGGEQIRVRMGMHTGQAQATATGLVGLDVHRAARVAADIAMEQMKDGFTDFLAELAAEISYQQALLSLVQAQATRFGDTVALYQALGGGWWHREDDSHKVAENTTSTGK